MAAILEVSGLKKTTMDRYVHVTDESLVNAVHLFENFTPTS